MAFALTVFTAVRVSFKNKIVVNAQRTSKRVTVETRYTKSGADATKCQVRDWQNVFVITGVRYIRVLYEPQVSSVHSFFKY